ncbi:putative amidoligase domain-containing protein [Cohnella sp. JJ-181]|uniref:putative amidoligase domain-containing protein n=1 Tax=Cohnella rhizoplanae TaxID=2974897 RepID=UPI0022FF7DD6|nr:hypothetical protein [Cohnella sp. JJ-181]CAI6081245.1 hypothetical protein COHCIP112018_03245 [Cohnella sp. JJ-181]
MRKSGAGTGLDGGGYAASGGNGVDGIRDGGIVNSVAGPRGSWKPDGSRKGGTVWVEGMGAICDLLASAGLRRLEAGMRPGAADVVVRLAGAEAGTSKRAASEAAGADQRVAAVVGGDAGAGSMPDRAEAFASGGQAGAWLWNAAADKVGALAPAELDRRLSREGLRSAIRASGDAAADAAFGWRTSSIGAGALSLRASDTTYVVTVFGLEAPVVRPDPGDHAAGRELARRLGRASARALYALGLELGTVTWQVNASGRRGVIVRLAASIGGLDEAGARRLADAASAFALGWAGETAGEAPDALLGADPEFVMLSAAGRIVPASKYFGPGEPAGSDSVVVRGVQRWPIAELRPRPAREPGVLAQRIRRLLQDAAARTAGAGLRWRAGAVPVRGLPLGGHLHFSGIALTSERLRALDNALALPLRLLEPAGAGRRRPRYGALGDYRPKAHGGFEYRTPPSWLVSPRLALGVLSLAKLAAEHARELSGCRPLDADALRDAFYDGEPALLRQAASVVRRALAALPAYARYRDAVDPLFDAIEAGRVWDESEDIRRRWRIPE